MSIVEQNPTGITGLDAIDLSEFIHNSRFMDTEDDALEWLAYYRTGGECPRCERDTDWRRVKNSSPRHSSKAYYCPLCAYQFSPLAGTIFHGTRTPLLTWCRLDILYGEGRSSSEIQRTLGLTRDTTLRIRQLFQQVWARA